MTLRAARAHLEPLPDPNDRRPPSSPPFTPRAKKVLEFALREALILDHKYIGTEHLLLGLIRERDGLGFQILRSMGVDTAALRSAVIARAGADDSQEDLDC